MLGQDWSQPPWRRTGSLSEPTVSRADQSRVAARCVRIDHIEYFRLWWIPDGTATPKA